jgi:hypothetical protein
MILIYINKHLLTQVILLKKIKISLTVINCAQKVVFLYGKIIMKDLNLLETVFIIQVCVTIYLKDIMIKMKVF